MLSAAIHRRLARKYLDRAYRAGKRDAKLKYLHLAVRNSMRAQIVDAEATPSEQPQRATRRGRQSKLTDRAPLG
jgi:hypothetical protein